MKSIESREYSARWYAANKDKPEFKAKHKERLKNWREKNPARYLWQKAKERAKLLNIPFDLEPEEIYWTAECPVLKVPFVFNTRYAASLDRIDPSKGYTKDNVQVMSRKANIMKQDASTEELRNFARWALSQYQL